MLLGGFALQPEWTPEEGARLTLWSTTWLRAHVRVRVKGVGPDPRGVMLDLQTVAPSARVLRASGVLAHHVMLNTQYERSPGLYEVQVVVTCAKTGAEHTLHMPLLVLAAECEAELQMYWQLVVEEVLQAPPAVAATTMARVLARWNALLRRLSLLAPPLGSSPPPTDALELLATIDGAVLPRCFRRLLGLLAVPIQPADQYLVQAAAPQLEPSARLGHGLQAPGQQGATQAGPWQPPDSKSRGRQGGGGVARSCSCGVCTACSDRQPGSRAGTLPSRVCSNLLVCAAGGVLAWALLATVIEFLKSTSCVY